MRRRLPLLAVLLMGFLALGVAPQLTQAPMASSGTLEPTTCDPTSVPALFWNTSSGALKLCTAPNVWTTVATGSAVQSVSGTANQISSTGGATPILSFVAAAVFPTSVVAPTVNATTGFQINGVSMATPIVCSNTAASSAIANVATETFFSVNCPIAANTLSTGKTISVDARGVFGALATDTLILKLKLCTVSGCGSGTGVALATNTTLTLGALTNQQWVLDANSSVFTSGASGTLDTQGYTSFQTAGTTIITDPMPNTALATVDETVQQFLSISAGWAGIGSPSATDTITLRNLRVVIQ